MANQDTPARAIGMAPMVLLIGLAAALAGCRQQITSAPKPADQSQNGAVPAAALELANQEGHAATVRCLRSERALTDGDELRCEDWNYVKSYGAPTGPQER